MNEVEARGSDCANRPRGGDTETGADVADARASGDADADADVDAEAEAAPAGRGGHVTALLKRPSMLAPWL